eukprot:XP_015578072.1 protein DYAD [Ricinus communis]
MSLNYINSSASIAQEAATESCSYMLTDPADHIKVGSFYEIDHSKLPPKCPDQLNSIRIVMVFEKTRMRVSLRFPSIYSLRAYFNETSTKSDIKKLPPLDEKFIMGSEIAADALYRRIPPQEITDKKNLWRFWAVPSITAHKLISNNSSIRSRNSTATVYNNNNKKGSLWSGINDTGMVKWGQRRQVSYLARHVNEEEDDSCKRELRLSCKVKSKEEESEGTENEEDDVKKKKGKSGKSLKRKQRGFSTCQTTLQNEKRKKKKSMMIKSPKREINNQIAVYKQKKHKVLKNSIDRWSAERYHLAEVNMLKIMKEQNAVFGKPILRPELRAQARKLIGDTGLLDHLLKHMAGKVAPSGEERFRRRHNAEGAMEYWLEKADLADIRREAGVQDPYWTPPPGWNPGDNPTQDPLCAREFKELKQEIAKLKRDMELLSKKHEEELAIVTTPISSATSRDTEHDNLIISLKEMFIDLVNKKAKIEKQLLEISKSLCGMEEDMGKLKTTVEEANRTESFERLELIGLPESVIAETVNQRKVVVKEGVLGQEQNKPGGKKAPPITKSAAPTEDKAAKIERLKSGFRICKPQGTFLWPNKGISSPQVVVQFEDLFSVPTPPSVSSTSAAQTHLLSATVPSDCPNPTSPPMKPLAEKRPVTINAPSSAVAKTISSPEEITHSTTQYDQNSGISTISTTSTTTLTDAKTSLINLNELPSNQNDNGSLCESQSQGQTSSYPVTYQRRNNHSVTITAAVPSLGPAKKETSQWEGNDQGKELIRCCSASSTTSSCLSVGAGTWLALATSNPSSVTKSKRG